MLPTEKPECRAPLPQACQVLELRQYTLHPQQRDALIDLFDREFVETQEAVGLRVIGQFRDGDDPDRFVWLRGFADMVARRQGLEAFYGGPVWAAHRSAANATMIDSDNVLLLRPAWPGATAGLAHGVRAAQGAAGLPGGVVGATVFHLKAPAAPDLLAFCRERMTGTLQDAGATVLGWCVTEPGPNTFPRLPVREGEPVLVGLALFRDMAAFDAFGRSVAWAPQVAEWLCRPPQSLRLLPTARSALHA